jgi:hypothetical protein
LCAWVAIASIASTYLAASMPAEGFFSGDSGVKLIAARNAIDHPSRPFEVDLPVIDGQPVSYLDRFFEVHGDHAHALQSPLFPVLSAFPIAAIGLRGAYVLPLLSFVAMIPLLNVIRRHSGSSNTLGFLIVLAIFASPVFFYGLEFWEHAPATACVTASTALVFADPGRGWRARQFAVAAGLLCGVAILLRPEALWYAVALAWVSRRRDVSLAFGLGGAAVLIPFAAANFIHSGNVAGPHATANFAAFGNHWLAARRHRLALWLVPAAPAGFIGITLVGAAWISSFAGYERRRRQILALLGGAVLAVAAARGAFGLDSLWTAWPAGALLFVPFPKTSGTRRLWFLALFSLGAIWLTSTHDGGAQWGPRFLLVSTPPLIVLSSYAAKDAFAFGYGQRLRQALVVIVVLAGLWSTRAAYRDLRATKQYYARVVRATESLTEPHGYVISDVWWYDQIVAALYGSRTFLYSSNAASANKVLEQLAAAKISDVTLVWSRDQNESDTLDRAVSGTCYRLTNVTDIPESDLTFAKAECLGDRQ